MIDLGIVALVNESGAPPEAVARACAAVRKQVERDFAPAHGITCDLRFYGAERNVPIGAERVILLDDSDAAGVLGYHATTPSGAPYARVFVAGQTIAEWIVTLSHEVLELLLDPPADLWVRRPDGYAVAREACDVVEACAYQIEVDGVPVGVSDFVLPSYFVAGSAGPWDHMGRLDGPFALAPGGYEIVRAPDGSVSQHFADLGSYPARKLAGKSHPAARSARRSRGPRDTIPVPPADRPTLDSDEADAVLDPRVAFAVAAPPPEGDA